MANAAQGQQAPVAVHGDGLVGRRERLLRADEAIAVDGNGRLLALGGIRYDGVFQPSKVFAKKE